VERTVLYEKIHKNNKIIYLMNSKMIFEKNKNCLFISLFNSGIYDLALNHLTTMKKQNIDNYLYFTTEAKLADKLQKMNFNVQYLEDFDIPQDYLQYSSSEWNKLCYHRFYLVKKYLIQYDYVWLLDVDTVVLDNLNKYIPKNNNTWDCIFQDDVNMPCCGCILFKATEATNKFLDFFIDNPQIVNDQIFLKYLMNTKQINFLKLKVFNRKLFPNGFLFFNKTIINEKQPFMLKEKEDYYNKPEQSPAFVHANFIIGMENKIKALKEYNLWFI